MAEKKLNTRILLKYDTYESWTTNNPVLKAGEMAIGTIPTGNPDNLQGTPPIVVVKVGDGSTAYKNLPFISGKAADVYAWAKSPTKPVYKWSEITEKPDFETDLNLASYVKKAGDTMTGELILSADPTESSDAKQAATKNYVDTAKSAAVQQAEGVQTSLNTFKNEVSTTYAPKASPTFTGVVTLPAITDSSAATSAATKKYVDDAKTAATTQANGVQSNLDTFKTTVSNTYAPKASPTFSGVVTLPEAAPTANTQAAHKKYVDDAVKATDNKLQNYAPLQNPSFTGAVTVPNAPTVDTHAANKKYVDDQIAANVASVFKFKGTVATTADLPASATVGDVYHVTANQTEYVYAKVDNATAATWEELGGILDLSAYETAEQAGNKYVNASGDTMTGALTLSADPTEALHAATKQYVDGKITALVKTDKAVEHQFVTEVSETDGIITVKREQPVIADIDGLQVALDGKADDSEITDLNTRIDNLNYNDIAQTAGDILVFDCGSSSKNI